MKTEKAQTLKKQIVKLFAMFPIMGMVFFMQSFTIKTETSAPQPPEQEKTVSELQDEDQIFTIVEDQPKFPGGDDAFMKFLMENLTYPEEARNERIQGTVFVTFVVERDGSISGVRVLRGVTPSLDEEAMRVVKAMPNWKPGYQRGQPVRVQFNLPLRFVLDSMPPKDALQERS